MGKTRQNTLVSEIIPLVSKITPCASQIPPITICRFLAVMPRWTRAEIVRKRKISPIEMGLMEIWLLPLELFTRIVEEIKEQAEAELELESIGENELLELKMRYDSGEISEKEYKKKEAELKRKLEAIKK